MPPQATPHGLQGIPSGFVRGRHCGHPCVAETEAGELSPTTHAVRPFRKSPVSPEAPGSGSDLRTATRWCHPGGRETPSRLLSESKLWSWHQHATFGGSSNRSARNSISASLSSGPLVESALRCKETSRGTVRDQRGTRTFSRQTGHLTCMPSQRTSARSLLPQQPQRNFNSTAITSAGSNGGGSPIAEERPKAAGTWVNFEHEGHSMTSLEVFAGKLSRAPQDAQKKQFSVLVSGFTNATAALLGYLTKRA